eukprot:1161838-Pelagomonas_calceolata.AAC.4
MYRPCILPLTYFKHSQIIGADVQGVEVAMLSFSRHRQENCKSHACHNVNADLTSSELRLLLLMSRVWRLLRFWSPAREAMRLSYSLSSLSLDRDDMLRQQEGGNDGYSEKAAMGTVKRQQWVQ